MRLRRQPRHALTYPMFFERLIYHAVGVNKRQTIYNLSQSRYVFKLQRDSLVPRTVGKESKHGSIVIDYRDITWIVQHLVQQVHRSANISSYNKLAL